MISLWTPQQQNLRWKTKSLTALLAIHFIFLLILDSSSIRTVEPLMLEHQGQNWRNTDLQGIYLPLELAGSQSSASVARLSDPPLKLAGSPLPRSVASSAVFTRAKPERKWLAVLVWGLVTCLPDPCLWQGTTGYQHSLSIPWPLSGSGGYAEPTTSVPVEHMFLFLPI